MSDIINEALLEMHFHPAIRDCFEAVFGAQVLRILKPSTQQEVWVGFDQGWVRTDYSTGEILADLRASIQGTPTIQRFYVGYFMQFKLMERKRKRSDYLPDGYVTPYYRAELSLKPNNNTGLSQHETLLRLATLPRTDVNYVCAFLESADEIYDPPNVDRLVCLEVSSAPAGWATGVRHFITVQDINNPMAHWCSEPVEARATPFSEWARREERAGDILTGEEAASLIESTAAALGVETRVRGKNRREQLATQYLPESLIIYEFGG